MEDFKRGPKPPTAPAVPGGKPESPSGSSSSAAGASDASKSEPELVFNTMQSDISGGEPAARVTPEPKSTPAPPLKPSLEKTPALPAAEKKQVPLPPKAGGKKVKASEPKKPRKKKGAGKIILAIVLFLIIAGVAGAAWWAVNNSSLLKPKAEPTPTEVAVATDSEILPAATDVIIRYNVADSADRQALASLWSRKGSPTISGLLEGDPRLLFTDTELTTIYYVVLPEDPRPYLVVPKTDGVQEVLQSDATAQVIEEKGWFIAHSVRPEEYQSALAKGTSDNIVMATKASTSPIQIAVSPALLQQLRSELLGSSASSGQVQQIILEGRPDQTNTFLDIAGSATALTSTSPAATTNQQLLSVVPSSIQFARLGALFNEDVAGWQEVSGSLSQAVIDEPAVQQLVSQHTGPYAFYVDTSTPNAKAYGLILELKPGEAESLQGAQETLEAALGSLVPLLTGRESVTPVTFNDATYAEIPLRFANLANSTVALDYAITPDYLLVATSKEAMFSLLDTVAGNIDPITTAAGAADVFSLWTAIPESRDLVLGITQSPLLSKLLPVAADSSLTFAATLSPDELQPGENILTGLLLLGAASTSVEEPATSPIESTPPPDAEPIIETEDTTLPTESS